VARARESFCALWIGDREDDHASSERKRILEPAPRIAAQRAPLLWFTRLSKTSPRPSASWVWRLPPRGSSPPRGLRSGGTGSCRAGDLPQAWAPLQSFARAPRRREGQRPHSPEVLCPKRHPSAEIHHSRALPTRVTLRPRTYHVPRRITPSTDSLVSFQPGALSGRSLQSLTGQRSRTPLGAASPLAIGSPTAVADSMSALLLHLPRLAVPKTCSSDEPEGPSLLDVSALALSAHGHRCRSGFASGVSSLCRLGCTAAGFLHVRHPWLSWGSSSLGLSPSESRPQRL